MDYTISWPNDNFTKSFSAIDTHVGGADCRVIYAGFPEPEGDSVMERKKYFEKNCDMFRASLMNEPRGHRDMTGVVLGKPVSPEADIAVYFIDSGGWLNMCGHCTIGTAIAVLETGIVPMSEPVTDIVLETPSGLIRVRAVCENGKVKEVTMTNTPAFLYGTGYEFEWKGQIVRYDIAYGGSFFALVDATQPSVNLEITGATIPALTELGMAIIESIPANVVKHPSVDINTVDLTTFYTLPVSPEANGRGTNIFGAGQADRTAGGTATSAFMAMKYAQGTLKVGENFINESCIESKFTGRIIDVAKVGEYDAPVIEITGSGHIYSKAEYVIAPDDEHKYGFVIG